MNGWMTPLRSMKSQPDLRLFKTGNKVATGKRGENCKLLVSDYAEKRTRTSTPLRGLEPESSASANSAISAKEFQSKWSGWLKSIGAVNCRDETQREIARNVQEVVS